MPWELWSKDKIFITGTLGNKDREVDFDNIPWLEEDDATENVIQELNGSISHSKFPRVIVMEARPVKYLYFDGKRIIEKKIENEG